MDVAVSLAKRSWQVVQAQNARTERRWLQNRAYCGHARVHEIDGGLDLWNQYMIAGRRHVETHADRFLRVKYEELLATPEPILTDILDFCGLSLDLETVQSLAKQIKPSRALAYRAEMGVLTDSQKKILGRWDYD